MAPPNPCRRVPVCPQRGSPVSVLSPPHLSDSEFVPAKRFTIKTGIFAQKVENARHCQPSDFPNSRHLCGRRFPLPAFSRAFMDSAFVDTLVDSGKLFHDPTPDPLRRPASLPATHLPLRPRRPLSRPTLDEIHPGLNTKSPSVASIQRQYLRKRRQFVNQRVACPGRRTGAKPQAFPAVPARIAPVVDQTRANQSDLRNSDSRGAPQLRRID